MKRSHEEMSGEPKQGHLPEEPNIQHVQNAIQGLFGSLPSPSAGQPVSGAILSIYRTYRQLENVQGVDVSDLDVGELGLRGTNGWFLCT